MEGDSYRPNTYTVRVEGTGRGYRHRVRSRSYMATFQTIIDDINCKWRQGDIIRFDSAFFDWNIKKKWQKWFMEKDKYLEYIRKNCSRDVKIPMYAHEEYAMIINRYRWIKNKRYRVFKDYGTIVMMLTGSKVGRIRRYFMTYPWKLIGKYPYKKNDHPHILKFVPLIRETWDDNLEIFLKNITEKLT